MGINILNTKELENKIIVKIAVAPRVYLIEQLIQMTKGVTQ